MILPSLLQRHVHHQMKMIGRKLSRMRWTQFLRMRPRRLLICLMIVNVGVESGCSRRSLSLVLLLRSTRLSLAKRYTQKKDEDFFDTYLNIARMTTICVLLSLAASYGLLVQQMDVKKTLLNGELD